MAEPMTTEDEVDRLREQECWLRGLLKRLCDDCPGLMLAYSHGMGEAVPLRGRKGREEDAERLDKFLNDEEPKSCA